MPDILEYQGDTLSAEEGGARAQVRVMILGMACVGGVAAAVACLFFGSCFERFCGTRNDLPICKMLITNPPWAILTGIAVTPAVLLTWYWRTVQRDRELELRRRELEARKRELDHRANELSLQQRQLDSSKSALDHQVAASSQSSAIARDSQQLDTYLRALDVLGSPATQTRIAGIALLSQVGKDSEHFAAAILSALSAYLWEHASFEKTPGTSFEAHSPPDVHAALEAVGAIVKKVDAHNAQPTIDLSGLKLSYLHLRGCDFRGANLSRCRFESVVFERCDLGRATLSHVVGTGVQFVRCSLVGAALSHSDMSDVYIMDSEFEGADFASAKISGDLAEIDKECNFKGATYNTQTSIAFGREFALEERGMLLDAY